ncbi:MAG: GGDEF domain-containing protein [Candidatus Eremiobacteraeota bacterium]|nr:GGDEF domain-containing protein [Candidatus Eremiobacteraeota bacterium]
MIEAVAENLRIEALERYRVLDCKSDATIDALTRLAADLCGTSMALVTLVDRRRQWFLSHIGTEATETPRELSFCAHAIEEPDRLLVVNSPTTDVRFKDNALVTGEPFIRFYAGMPIVSPEGFALGALCVLDSVPHTLRDEQARALRALATQVGALLEARRHIRELKGQLDQRSHTRENFQRLRYVDALTGAPDRAQLMRVIARAYARLQANPHMRAAVVLVGVDGVKVVDESLGHGVGDALMGASVERIAHALRAKETVARYGDNQIVVLLEDIENAVEAANIAKRILALFESSFQIGEHSLRVRANVGMTITDGTHQRGADLVRDAASAMYHAKTLGEGTFASFTPALHDMAVKRLRVEGELRRAIDADEFRLYYQPIVALKTTAIVGFEALIRWQHPERGLVMPDEFIGIAEETGLIDPIGDWVLREGCRQMNAWRRQNLEFGSLSLSVNVSARQFNNSRLYDIVRNALDEAQLPPNCLQIELTETALIESSDAAVATLVRLRDLGVAAHLDDFGCGYSSLHYLRKFPVTTLKIDRSFISSSGSGVADPEIVQAVILLAAKLNVDVTAEGIETPEQLDELRTFGCARAQGYYFYKPLDADAVARLFAKQRDSEPLSTVS